VARSAIRRAPDSPTGSSLNSGTCPTHRSTGPGSSVTDRSPRRHPPPVRASSASSWRSRAVGRWRSRSGSFRATSSRSGRPARARARSCSISRWPRLRPTSARRSSTRTATWSPTSCAGSLAQPQAGSMSCVSPTEPIRAASTSSSADRLATTSSWRPSSSTCSRTCGPGSPARRCSTTCAMRCSRSWPTSARRRSSSSSAFSRTTASASGSSGSSAIR